MAVQAGPLITTEAWVSGAIAATLRETVLQAAKAIQGKASAFIVAVACIGIATATVPTRKLQTPCPFHAANGTGVGATCHHAIPEVNELKTRLSSLPRPTADGGWRRMGEKKSGRSARFVPARLDVGIGTGKMCGRAGLRTCQPRQQQ